MDSKNSIMIEVNAASAQELKASMRRMERREWHLWWYAILMTILLALCIATFSFPALLAQQGEDYAFSLNHAVRGLVGLVLIFNVYVVYQQVQINRIRRQLTNQVFAVDKVELLAEEVYKLAVLDPLTGLHNRRYMDQRLVEEIARSERHGYPLTVILFDLNDFKQVNDTFGHEAGDRLLKSFAEQLSKGTRGSDLAARYGGDEFVVLLPECKPDDVQYVLKRLERLKVDIGGKTLPVSYSAGWTDYAPGESPQEFLNRADSALYDNKRIAKGQGGPVVARANSSSL